MAAETVAGIIGAVIMAYICCGIVFTIAFLIKGIANTDEAAHGSGWGFKMIIAPGIIALWPALLMKWVKAKQHI